MTRTTSERPAADYPLRWGTNEVDLRAGDEICVELKYLWMSVGRASHRVTNDDARAGTLEYRAPWHVFARGDLGRTAKSRGLVAVVCLVALFVVVPLAAVAAISGAVLQADTATPADRSGASGEAPSAAAEGEPPPMLAPDPAAQQAAQGHATDLLSYDWQTLDTWRAAVSAVSTSRFSEENSNMFEVVEQNAPTSQSSVTTQVTDSAVIRQTSTEAAYLLFVSRQTNSSAYPTDPLATRDAVVVTIVAGPEGRWLLDEVQTSGPQVTQVTDPSAVGPVSAAEAFMTVLSTYGGEDTAVEDQLATYEAALTAVATPAFAADFTDDARESVAGMLRAGASRTFEFHAAGIEVLTADTATVLISGSFTDAYGGEEKDPVPANMRVELVSADGEEWKADGFSPLEG